MVMQVIEITWTILILALRSQVAAQPTLSTQRDMVNAVYAMVKSTS